MTFDVSTSPIILIDFALVIRYPVDIEELADRPYTHLDAIEKQLTCLKHVIERQSIPRRRGILSRSQSLVARPGFHSL